MTTHLGAASKKVVVLGGAHHKVAYSVFCDFVGDL